MITTHAAVDCRTCRVRKRRANCSVNKSCYLTGRARSALIAEVRCHVTRLASRGRNNDSAASSCVVDAPDRLRSRGLAS